MLLAASSLLLATARPPAGGGHVDPPLRLVLQIDGQQHRLLDGQEATLTIAGAEHKVRVAVAPTRLFDAAGVQFEFPRDTPLQFADTGAMQTWTLDGSDVVLTLHRQHGTRGPLAAAILSMQAEALGGATAAPAATTMDLGGTSHAAFATTLRLSSARLRLRAVDLEAGDASLTLVLQDSTGDDGNDSAECQRLLALLAKTFVVTAAK